MIKHIVLFASLTSTLAFADLIETKKSEAWNIDGLAHYVRSKENKRFSANLVSTGRNTSVVAFYNPSDYCKRKPATESFKIQYQWVNYVSTCIGGNNFWVPKSQKGKDFVKQAFSRNADVKVVFKSKNYTFSTKKFTSVKQQWERTVRTVGDAL